MLSKCANPACKMHFRYLREGKLYQFEIKGSGDESKPGEGKKPVRRVEHFWLCDGCAANMKLTLEDQHRVVVVPFKNAEKRRAAAS